MGSPQRPRFRGPPPWPLDLAPPGEIRGRFALGWPGWLALAGGPHQRWLGFGPGGGLFPRQQLYFWPAFLQRREGLRAGACSYLGLRS